MTIEIIMCPRSGTRTFLDTRFAVGRFLHSAGYGPAQLTVNTCQRPHEHEVGGGSWVLLKMAIGRMRKRSMKRNYRHG